MINLNRTLRSVSSCLQSRKPNIRFLSPATAACFSAARLNGRTVQPIFGNDDVEQYAHVIGLSECLRGGTPSNQPLRGRTYSPLVHVQSDHDVDACNSVINDLIANQLGHFAAVAQHAYYLVGELHNNVPAHANGAGFSMAQFYGKKGVLEVAVADGGCGMLPNVQRFDPGIQTHIDAIQWCLVEGNTTGQSDPWAQQLPDDALSNPYSDGVPTTDSNPNHHVGLGLARLQQFVHLASGEFAVWSGDEYLVSSQAGQNSFSASHYWDGVVVVFRLPLSGNDALQSHDRGASAASESLAERIGL